MELGTRGGRRENSGRKRKPATKTINFRVPIDQANEIKSKVSIFIKELIMKQCH